MTLLALRQTHPVTNSSQSPHVQRRHHLPTFTGIFSLNFHSDVTLKNLWAREFGEELMKLLYRVYWMMTKLSCVYLHVDPVCDRCQPAHEGYISYVFSITYILDFSISSLSELVWLQLCLQFYHSLCSYLSVQFSCFVSVIAKCLILRHWRKSQPSMRSCRTEMF